MISRRLSKGTDFYAQTGTGGNECKTIRLKHECPECGDIHFLDVDKDKLSDWMDCDVDHGYVQDYWPEVPIALREEFFMSGICPTCWDSMFGIEEE